MTRAATAWRWSCMRNSLESIAPRFNASWTKRTKPAPIPKPCAATPPSSWWWTDRQSQHEGSKNTFAVTLAADQNEKQSTMNKLEIKGDWNITKGKLKQKCAKLTDDDLQFVEGKHDELLGRIQKRTGETRETVEKAVKEATSCCCK